MIRILDAFRRVCRQARELARVGLETGCGASQGHRAGPAAVPERARLYSIHPALALQGRAGYLISALHPSTTPNSRGGFKAVWCWK